MNIMSFRKKILWPAIITSLLITNVSFAGPSSGNKTTMEDVKEEMREAAGAIKNYTTGQRDEAAKRIKLTLTKLDAQIERLEDRLDQKAARMDQAARSKARASLKALRKHRNKLAEWAGGMQHSSNEAWQDIKTGFLKSYKNMQEAFNKAQQEF